MKKLILAFNWKMNPEKEKEALSLFKEVEKGAASFKGETIIFPPFVFLSELSKARGKKNNLALGAQDVFWEEKGAYIGEISPAMIKDTKGEWVIIGHSERRKLGDTNEIISKKILAALQSGLKIILCVGEDKKMPLKKTELFLLKQLDLSLSSLDKNKFSNLESKIIIAYEPIWAIGTGQNSTPEYAETVSQFIKKILQEKFNLSLKVLYGGSVNSENISSFLNEPSLSGTLIGGAGLHPDEIKKIMKISANV